MFKRMVMVLGLALAPVLSVNAAVFLTLEQARQVLWQGTPMQAVPIILTEAQAEAIEEASDIRVLTNKVHAWKTETGGWFLVDQVIGKHEMIDVAVAINPDGTIKGLQIMKYVESYGSEVKHPKWLAQFHGRDNSVHLKLDEQIDNISGATLSSRHITDGVNRWLHTWDQVLQYQ
ncbi:MAG: FMN-binding protein [Cycloclasticus sp.]